MIEQRSKEWFKQRVSKITGSNVGAILGIDPFRSKNDVMRQMVRASLNLESEFKGNIATEYGTKFESFAQKDFEMETGFNVEETGFHVASDYDWLGASPDGLVGDGAVLEIKCPYSMRNGGEFKSIYDQPQYYAQIQIEMLCTGRHKTYFYQWCERKSKLEIVGIDVFWLDENIHKLESFYKEYLSELKAPDKHELSLVKSVEAKELAAVFEETNEKIKQLKSVLDDCKAQLITLADGEKSNISGVLVYPIKRKGAIQYKKIPELDGVDLEKYRGKDTKAWGVR